MKWFDIHVISQDVTFNIETKSFVCCAVKFTNLSSTFYSLEELHTKALAAFFEVYEVV